MVWLNQLFSWWNTKGKRTLRWDSLYKYWFCYKNGKKNYPQVYLEEGKYRIKEKIKLSEFINAELELKFLVLILNNYKFFLLAIMFSTLC